MAKKKSSNPVEAARKAERKQQLKKQKQQRKQANEAKLRSSSSMSLKQEIRKIKMVLANPPASQPPDAVKALKRKLEKLESLVEEAKQAEAEAAIEAEAIASVAARGEKKRKDDNTTTSTNTESGNQQDQKRARHAEAPQRGYRRYVQKIVTVIQKPPRPKGKPPQRKLIPPRPKGEPPKDQPMVNETS